MSGFRVYGNANVQIENCPFADEALVNVSLSRQETGARAVMLSVFSYTLTFRFVNCTMNNILYKGTSSVSFLVQPWNPTGRNEVGQHADDRESALTLENYQGTYFQSRWDGSKSVYMTDSARKKITTFITKWLEEHRETVLMLCQEAARIFIVSEREATEQTIETKLAEIETLKHHLEVLKPVEPDSLLEKGKALPYVEFK